MDLSDSDSADPLSPYSHNDTPFKNNSSKTGLLIECRVTPQWWLRVLMCLVLSALLFTAILKVPSKPSDKLVITLAGAMGLLSGGFAIWMVLELMRSVIRADETGLTWRRSFGGWRSARWEEITDYYRASPVYKSGIVETPAGKVELWDKYAGFERIADLVIEKTPHINNAGWEMKGTRSNENWSRTFSPWSFEQMTTAPFMTAFICYSVVGTIKMLIDSNNRNHIFKGLAHNTSALLIVLIVGGLSFGLFAYRTNQLWREWLFAIKHRDEKLVLDAKRLVFTSRERHHEATWQEIKRISLLPKVKGMTPVQVETDSERFIICHFGFSTPWQKIKLILEQYAARALKNGESRR